MMRGKYYRKQSTGSITFKKKKAWICLRNKAVEVDSSLSLSSFLKDRCNENFLILFL